MILQALCDYYQRKATDGSSALAARGFEEKPIPFVIVINTAGEFIQLQDTREKQGKKLQAHSFLVPKATTRSGAKSYAVVNPLWDHYGYLLAQPKRDKPDTPPLDKDIAMAQKQHASFIQYVEDISETLGEDEGVAAVKRFLANPTEKDKVVAHEFWPECYKIKGCNLSFRLVNTPHLVCQSSNVIEYIKQQSAQKTKDAVEGVCLITGDFHPIARLHSAVSGVNTKPSPFASVNLDAPASFGKTQGFNFPVSENSVFEYTTALNYLLRRDSPNKFRISDTAMICWSEKLSSLETALPLFFSEPPKDNPDAFVNAVLALYSSLHNGTYQGNDKGEKFFVLGLAPNSARIVVRLWQVGTVAEMSEHIAHYFDDLDIIGRDHYGRPSLFRLLSEVAHLGRSENIPPNLISDTTRTILAGIAFPQTLLQLSMRRIKADQNINYRKAALIKACLNRSSYLKKELSVSLDSSETDIGYRLGRLFSVLEKTQRDANASKLNSTIRDRYYGAASSTPVTVFATLIKLSNHHLAKLTGGHRVNREKLFAEIIDKIKRFPPNLSLEQQGMFAIGYYHQQQDLFTKKSDQQGEAT